MTGRLEMFTVARLKPGVGRGQAEGELKQIRRGWNMNTRRKTLAAALQCRC